MHLFSGVTLPFYKLLVHIERYHYDHCQYKKKGEEIIESSYKYHKRGGKRDNQRSLLVR